MVYRYASAVYILCKTIVVVVTTVKVVAVVVVVVVATVAVVVVVVVTTVAVVVVVVVTTVAVVSRHLHYNWKFWSGNHPQSRLYKTFK